ncbi:uncharacterized protein ColSpa_10135 [Colletotrichum spaethianum]|uniref:Uncharacterized protein n=1 Tax=Colletotrichum spaethianum TaxID=700344 RepID=A0AA37PD13_9PEZI|nr:uncharacterized protein ColSpa_10135 [Colletotrichum spaethianum]GKT49954.1 hypothetical protein ColSpa_10135 [Colletotrichum spaethianum]
MDVEDCANHIQRLQMHNLDQYIQENLEKKPVKQIVHCEVLLQDFLIRGKMVQTRDYWDNTMFIATSKPPCRLCRYYLKESEDEFLVQSSHMNVYPKWRLPDMYQGQEEETITHREELLDDIIQLMQQDTLRLVKELLPQWKRYDSALVELAGDV